VDLDPEIVSYYERGEERDRIAGPSVERVRTLELLERLLPPAPAVVLDVGGGAGVYAFTLAGRGYEVHLLDPVALHVEQARAAAGQQSDAPLAAIEQADARALPRADDSADAVLLLGPLYHLTETGDRARALAEARRVLRPGGVLLAAAISRFASTWDGLAQGFFDEEGFEAGVEATLRDGRHTNPGRAPRRFTTAFFHLPHELREEVRNAGFETVGVLAVEGPASWLPDESAWLLDPERRERLLRAVRRVEAEPSLLGASAHLLAVARA